MSPVFRGRRFLSTRQRKRRDNEGRKRWEVMEAERSEISEDRACPKKGEASVSETLCFTYGLTSAVPSSICVTFFMVGLMLHQIVVSKLVQPKRVSCEGEETADTNELEKVDAAY
ncbi:unnamed protein product [Prunus brigantina]